MKCMEKKQTATGDPDTVLFFSFSFFFFCSGDPVFVDRPISQGHMEVGKQVRVRKTGCPITNLTRCNIVRSGRSENEGTPTRQTAGTLLVSHPLPGGCCFGGSGVVSHLSSKKEPGFQIPNHTYPPIQASNDGFPERRSNTLPS